MHFYTDCWKQVGGGREINDHQLQTGEIASEGIRRDPERSDHFWHTMTLTDGRKFERSSNYWIHSPYGWEEVTS